MAEKAANSGVVDVIALATADADFVPLVKAIREAGPLVIVAAFANLAATLADAADRVIGLPDNPRNWAI